MIETCSFTTFQIALSAFGFVMGITIIGYLISKVIEWVIDINDIMEDYKKKHKP